MLLWVQLETRTGGLSILSVSSFLIDRSQQFFLTGTYNWVVEKKVMAVLCVTQRKGTVIMMSPFFALEIHTTFISPGPSNLSRVHVPYVVGNVSYGGTRSMQLSEA